MMDAAAGFMGNTLNDVLNMSKIEEGSISLIIQAFPLVSLIESAIRAVRTLARTKSVRIVVKGLSPKDDARGQSVMGDEVNINISLILCAFYFYRFFSLPTPLTLFSSPPLFTSLISLFSFIFFIGISISLESSPTRTSEFPSECCKI